ncbi:hypothetical protein BCR34DRAFT_106548 [Clohesyomyces aquaticus]|uniref:Secreted protein n=1 Tax=Clohesyomyces aquaticus TaxID=1231657 RepID=A0A1Y2A1S4_9PLEO|nr:hypothetical protein BCR34DRAFT_106548 [Clohesyomyces aquaticus]
MYMWTDTKARNSLAVLALLLQHLSHNLPFPSLPITCLFGKFNLLQVTDRSPNKRAKDCEGTTRCHQPLRLLYEGASIFEEYPWPFCINLTTSPC